MRERHEKRSFIVGYDGFRRHSVEWCSHAHSAMASRTVFFRLAKVILFPKTCGME